MHHRIVFIIAVLGIMVLVNITPAVSQEKAKDLIVVDLNTFDCKSFLKMSGDERDITVAFFHGHNRHEQGNER